MSDTLLPALPAPADTPVGKRFATWVFTVRKARGIGQATLADEAKTSRSWMSRIENGETLPNPALAQRICQVLEDDPFRAMEALDADRRYVERQAMGKKRGKGMRLTKDEREARGRDVRLALLRSMARRLVTHGGHASFVALARDMDLTDKTVRKHLGLLEDSGYVKRATLLSEVAQYQLTLDGLERALEAGGGWSLPPAADADPVWLAVARMVLGQAPRIKPAWDEGIAAKGETPPAPAPTLEDLKAELTRLVTPTPHAATVERYASPPFASGPPAYAMSAPPSVPTALAALPPPPLGLPKPASDAPPPLEADEDEADEEARGWDFAFGPEEPPPASHASDRDP